jgi:lipopolysaccharide transport system ATP-binding protein
MSEEVLTVQEVSKRYDIYERPQDRLRQLLPPRLRGGRRCFREFWALRDVSFGLQRGEALGILGRNGAGKSTLLEIVAGTSSPTSGTVSARGRVGALLELGSGFAPEFTGRENVRLNAALLGLSSLEIDERFEEIAAFADIGEFMERPVKTYSTGMLLRVAFAVQTALQPEILIVDEALAVGDARFQKKCFERLAQLQKAGTTLLLVTHDSGTVVQFCTRAMILEGGRVYAAGEPQRITREYHKLLFGPETPEPGTGNEDRLDTPSPFFVPNELQKREVRYGSGEASIVRVGLRDARGEDAQVIETHSACEAYFHARFNAPVERPVAYGFIVANARGVEVYGTKSGLHATALPAAQANGGYECRLSFVARLAPGRYFLSVALAHDDESGRFLDYRFDALEFQVAGASRAFTTSLVDLDASLGHSALH